MKIPSSIRLLYAIAALYDGVLGLAFLAAGPAIFAAAGITPPNHWGYVHFAAGLLAIFGLMFLMIALRPWENRNLIVYGILLKVCYVGTVAWHWAHGGIPDMWKYFAAADTVFAVLFFWSMIPLESAARPEDSAATA